MSTRSVWLDQAEITVSIMSVVFVVMSHPKEFDLLPNQYTGKCFKEA